MRSFEIFIPFCATNKSVHFIEINFSSKLESLRFSRINKSCIEIKNKQANKQMEVKRCCWYLSLRTGCLIFLILEIIYLIEEFVSGEHWLINVFMLPFPLLGLFAIYLVSECSNRVHVKKTINDNFPFRISRRNYTS